MGGPVKGGDDRSQLSTLEPHRAPSKQSARRRRRAQARTIRRQRIADRGTGPVRILWTRTRGQVRRSRPPEQVAQLLAAAGVKRQRRRARNLRLRDSELERELARIERDLRALLRHAGWSQRFTVAGPE